jgi:hypothetical protein
MYAHNAGQARGALVISTLLVLYSSVPK